MIPATHRALSNGDSGAIREALILVATWSETTGKRDFGFSGVQALI